jgi:hypothetical protein
MNMNKIVFIAITLTMLLSFSSCATTSEKAGQVMPQPQTEFNQLQPEGTVALTPEASGTETTPAAGAQDSESSDEKQPPATPATDDTSTSVLETAAKTPASDADMAKAAEAYDTGDVALCEQISDPALKDACKNNFAATDNQRKEESTSVVTPGTPQ